MKDPQQIANSKNNVTSKLLILILFMISSFALCQAQIVMDGNLDDWDENSFEFDPNNTLYYSVSKDSDNLYIAIKKNEKLMKVTTSKIIGGIQIFINNKGKKDTTNSLNIGYPTGHLNKLDLDQFFLNNIADLKERKLLSVYNDFGITAAAKANYELGALKSYHCEYKIPIEYLNSKNKELWICILLKGLRWRGKTPVPYGTGTIASTSNDLNKDDIYDAMDWSYTWFKYVK